MSYDSKRELNFNNVAKFARNFAKKESPKASKILDFIVNKSKKDYLNLCFTYLRWVDNIVDQPDLPVYQKKQFIAHQKNLISCLYTNNDFETTIIEETCLIYFAEYAVTSGNFILLDEVKNMIRALSMDANRLDNSGVFSCYELNHYIKLMSKSLFNILCNFLIPKAVFPGKEFYLGKFTANAQMIRDLDEDIDAGFINISSEDINHYNLDIKNLKDDDNLSFWLAEKTKLVLRILYEETALLKYLPVKFRIFTYYSLIYYLTWIVRIKVYDYNLKGLSNKTFFKEFETYFISFFISINIFIKGFIFTSKFDNRTFKINKKDKTNLNLREILNAAEKFTRSRAFKLWIQATFLIPRKRRKYFYLCHTYLRWVDDYVDNPENNKLSKIEFVKNQLKLIDIITKEENTEPKYRPKSNEEFFLYHYIKYAQYIKNYNLISEIRKIVEIIGIDANRLNNNGIFSNDELNQYLENLSKPVFNLIYYFLLPSHKIPEKNKCIGNFMGYVLMLRDFFEDLDAGYINIGREDIKRYNLNMANLKNDNNRFNWMASKYPEYLKLMNEEISVLKSMPLKVKLFWLPAFPVFLIKLIRIKAYNYNFGEKLKKNFYKEFKVYSQYLSLSLKVYLKVLL